MNEHAIRAAVRERYGRLARTGASCCGGEEIGATFASPCCGAEDATAKAQGSCCGDAPVTLLDGQPVPEDLAGASLGCGAPIDAAAPAPGETVVDLGSGAGLDAFLAAERVGSNGRVIGVDMTPEMIAKARANAERLQTRNVEFRLGEIEHLPLGNAEADVVVSNCVINLLPDKRPAFREAFRVLRPGGRMVVSDIVSAAPLPEAFKSAEMWTACLGGAIPEAEYLALIADAGFTDIEVVTRRGYVAAGLFSVTVRAVKPNTSAS
ncbi:MAG: arsenite methyltransferase [Armatimonadota bacterium]|nr:arsenite methyltransferase [Armatimonadota bacterium]